MSSIHRNLVGRAKQLLGGMGVLLAWGAGWALELPAEPLLNLKSEEFQQRERAQAELLTWARGQPQPAMDALLRHSRLAGDPEERERCLAVLRALVTDEYLNEGEGYMGIRMQDELANVPGDPKPRSVIRVIQVVPESAAHKAGLQPNDLIVGLAGQVWHEGAISRVFSEQIRQLKPKAKVMLQVLRAAKLLEIQVILGRRPLLADPQLPGERAVDPETAERVARDAYFRRWLERKKSPK